MNVHIFIFIGYLVCNDVNYRVIKQKGYTTCDSLVTQYLYQYGGKLEILMAYGEFQSRSNTCSSSCCTVEAEGCSGWVMVRLTPPVYTK